jgi:hypothetical protein
VTPIGLRAKKTVSPCLIWLFAPSVLWRRKDFGSIPKKSMLEANTPRLGAEGVAVRDSEFKSGLRFIVGLNCAYEIAAQSGMKPSVTDDCGGVGIECRRPKRVNKTRMLFWRLFAIPVSKE